MLALDGQAQRVVTTDLADLKRTDTGDRPVVDMLFPESYDTSDVALLAVNDQGNIFRFLMHNER